jgi:hypothetical protein
MARYKKATQNEYEMPEISGVKPILRLTVDERFEVINLFKEQARTKSLDVVEARKIISKCLFNSLYLWKDGKRTTQKEADSLDITENDIDAYVVDNLFNLWVELLIALEIVSKDEMEKQKKKMLEEAEKEDKKSPN